MKNFDYIRDLAEYIPGFKQLHAYCDKAESFQATLPEESASNARKALEWLVRNMLHMSGVTTDVHTSLNDMLHMPETYAFVNNDYNLRHDMSRVQHIGNAASHYGGQEVGRTKAYCCLRALYNVVQGFLYRWEAITDPLVPFNATLVPQSLTGPVVASSPEPQVEPTVVSSVPPEAVEHPHVPAALPHESLESEAITRKYLIDYMLAEAGWEVLAERGAVQAGKACIEVEVGHMPTASGKGRADYVLYGRDGRPLAVIEAKATSHDVGEGRQQALLYAAALEQRYGVKPVVYYSNGFHTMVIDRLGYTDRQVYSFHSADDLDRLVQKQGRAQMHDLRINPAITDRDYQRTAVKSIVEWFNAKHRRGLLVLATGTGKTRVSISLCDVMMRNNWVKTVLFLADRTALVGQAHRNYEALLPGVSMTVLSEDSEPNLQARIMFSTYQTMINYINSDEKSFSVGRFDLIVIDEAHRSVFGRYGAIFNYFDSLLIGLTATPRDEISRSTYDLLGLDNGVPNYSYDLAEAVRDEYLVPYETLQYHSKIMETGIKWDDLSQAERDQLDEVWTYEKVLAGKSDDEDYHRDIAAHEVFDYLYNTDTVDKVLQELMTHGLKVNNGEDIGKTIIFAINHRHAELIVKRFGALYPEKGPQYCQLIDNKVKYADDLILNFAQSNKMPQVAVSVDMLDTGIDVPSILNLVFFKRVRSKIKFMQMIGRGTRLCKGLFNKKNTENDTDKSNDKTKFYIFDWCNNFEYFAVNARGAEPVEIKSLTERIFSLRLDVAWVLQDAEHQEREADKRLHDELKTLLCSQVASLSRARIDVREKLDCIEPYRDLQAWECLSAVDVARLKGIAYLLPRSVEDVAAKKFDVIMLTLQLSKLNGAADAGRPQASVIALAKRLEKKTVIPLVKTRLDTLREVQTADFWQNCTVFRLERVRNELRDLMHLLEEDRKGRKFVIDIDDITTGTPGASDPPVVPRATYQERLIDYLASHTGNATLKKIQHLEQLTGDDIAELQRILWEELGTREEYNAIAGHMRYGNNVAAFLRSVLGIDHRRAMEKYGEFIRGAELNSQQERCLKEILDYVSVNGDISTSVFVEPPFAGVRWSAVFGDQFGGLRDFVARLHQVISAPA